MSSDDIMWDVSMLCKNRAEHYWYNALFFKGLHYIKAGRAAVIIANNPIVIALFSALLFKERLTPLKILSLLLSVSGALIVVTKGHILTIFGMHHSLVYTFAP